MIILIGKGLIKARIYCKNWRDKDNDKMEVSFYHP